MAQHFEHPANEVLVWKAPGPFSGEDLHRLAHYRLPSMLAQGLPLLPHSVKVFQGSAEALLARCLESSPIALVLPAFRSHLWSSVDLLKRLRVDCPTLPVLFSGWGADPSYMDTVWGGEPARHPRLILARGEPEAALTDALLVLLSQGYDREALAACGVALADGKGGWTHKGWFREASNLGDLPSPYLSGHLQPRDFGGMVLIEVARGCLQRCRFCLTCNFSTGGLRSVPIERVIAEIDYGAKAGANEIGFLCSGLNYDVEMLESIADALDAYPRPLRVDSTLHTAYLDPRRVAAIQRIPWGRMIIGLQSTNPEAMKLMKRRTDLVAFREAIEMLSQWGTPTVELILGLPGDSLQGFRESLDYALSLPAEVEVYPLRLDPGTDFMKERDTLGLQADFGRQGRVLSTETFSADELKQAEEYLLNKGSAPWNCRARRLGYDFAMVVDVRTPHRSKG